MKSSKENDQKRYHSGKRMLNHRVKYLNNSRSCPNTEIRFLAVPFVSITTKLQKLIHVVSERTSNLQAR